MPASIAQILDLMEYANDGAAQAAFVTNGLGVSQYPPAQNGTYVQATSSYQVPYLSTDPAISLTGTQTNQCWISDGANTNQRFHIDLGAAKVIQRIYYENFHNTGSDTNKGAKNFTFWGSNDAAAFADLTYGDDTNWTQLTCDISQFVEHVALNQADPHYVNVTNTTAYRYYAIKIADFWGAASYCGIRRIELQSALSLQDYSESTIKQEGSYSLKGVAAATGSLNKYLLRTVSPTIDLSNKTIVKFDIRASRTGSNIRIDLYNGGTLNNITPNILSANTWQTVVWDISAIANADKNAIDGLGITITNADADNTFYIDNMFADIIPNYLIQRGRDRFRTTGISLG